MTENKNEDIDIQDTGSHDSQDYDGEEEINQDAQVTTDLKTYVGQALFIEIRYDIDSLEKLCMSEHIGLINSSMVKGQEAEKRLAQTHQINNTPTDEEKKHIMSFETYVQYTEDTNTITLNLQKLFLVGSTLLSEFTYRRQNLAIGVSFVENGEQYQITLTEFIDYMVRLYAKSGKKLCIVDKHVEACKFLDYLIIKDRYTINGKVTIPTHLRNSMILKEGGLTEEQLLFFMGDSKISVLASTILGSKKIQEQKNDGGLVEGKKQFTGSTIHSLDDILTSKMTRRKELQSLADAMLLDTKIKVTREQIINSLTAAAELSEAVRAEQSLKADCGEFNAGWITAPSTPVGEDQERQVARKALFLQKFQGAKHLIYYIKSPVVFFFVRSEIGRIYTSEKAIKSYIEALPKIFHYIQTMAPGCRRISGVFLQRVKALLTQMGQTLGGNDKNMIARMANQLTFNRVVWFRDVQITKLGTSKPKYLPINVYVENAVVDDNEDDEEFVAI